MLKTKQLEWMLRGNVRIMDGRYINEKRLKKLFRLVLKYNRLAEKWGYDEILLDSKYYNVAQGAYQELPCPPDINVWQRFVHGFRDGYLEDLYRDIIEAGDGLFLDDDLYKKLRKQSGKV